MYTESMSRGYAERIAEDDLREEFRARIAQISFQNVENMRIASALAVEDAFRDTRVWGLFQDFNNRIFEFVVGLIPRDEAPGIGFSVGFGLDTASRDCQVPIVDHRVVNSVMIGDLPASTPSLSIQDFPESKDGDILFEGTLHFATAGTRPGLGCDCEYVLTDHGEEFFDNNLFRIEGIQAGVSRVRVFRKSNGFAVELID